MTRSKRRTRIPSTQDVYSDAEEENEQVVKRLHARVDIEAFGQQEDQFSGGNDSELDENEAFNSEDEKLYGSFFNKSAPESESDDECALESGELLSDLLGKTPAPRLTTTRADFVDDSDEEANESKHQQLRVLAEQLNPSKKPKRREEIHENISAPSSVFAKRLISRKEDELTMDSLLGASAITLKNFEEASTPHITGHLHLNKIKKQVKTALITDESSKEVVRPLESSVLLDRETRKIAYKSKKKELDVFQPLVKANREKETLDLRLQAPEMTKMTPAMLVTNFKPRTSMELQVHELLKSGGMDDKSIMEQEEDMLAHNRVSKEEIAKRQKELSKMRSLLFYQEQKQKRIKKIKSKLYHKIRNKQEERKSHFENVSVNEQEMAEKRAEERMSLKHTNTSKWVKHHLKRGVLTDQGTRTAIAEQLERGQNLRKKMEAAYSDIDDEDEDEDASSGKKSSDDLEKSARSILNEIQEDQECTEKVKGLHGMKFMQKAQQKQRDNARLEAERLLLELQEDHESGFDDVSDTEENVSKAPVERKSDVGNMRLTKGQTACSALTIAVDLTDSEIAPSTDIQLVEKHSSLLPKSHQSVNKTSVEPEEENPWLATHNTKSKKLNKHIKTPVKSKDVAISNAMDALSTAVATHPSTKSALKRKMNENSPKQTLSKRPKTPNSQQELVRQAFAFADEDDTIAREKDLIASKDSNAIKGAEIAKLIGMNGWGTWAGEGVPVSSHQKSRQREAEKLVEITKKQILAKREDSKLANVLINEKKDKQVSKFMTKEVPYPFTCRAEYEMAMRNPLGNDWNTLHATNSLTMPKIMKRAGQEIAPLTLNKEQKKWSIQMMAKQRKGKF